MSENREPTQKMMVNHHNYHHCANTQIGGGPHFFRHTQFDGFWGYQTTYGDLIRNKSGLSDKLQENSVSSLESGFFTLFPSTHSVDAFNLCNYIYTHELTYQLPSRSGLRMYAAQHTFSTPPMLAEVNPADAV